MASDILIVDDEADIRTLTSGILTDEGFDTRQSATSSEAIAELEARRPNLVLLDIWLQGSDMDGLGILREIKKNHPSVPVLMMSGHGTVETAVAAIKDGAYDFIEKPFKADRLILLVERTIEAARLRRENKELKLRAGAEMSLLGNSKLTRDLDQMIDKVALTNSRIMITGEAGSGKELVARMIHERSARHGNPFVVVNCAAMAPDIMEEQLFGVEAEKLNAEAGRVGTFEAAHKGTLLLDRIADMPLETQGKIVRALQDQVFCRVGGSLQVEVDVRVIATTNRDLRLEINAGRFREDLFYRLNVVSIEVPPLSARREDIIHLVNHFLTRACETAGRPVLKVADDAMSALQSYDWPGNVRELKNVAERILIFSPKLTDSNYSEPVGTDCLPPEVLHNVREITKPDSNTDIMTLPLRDARKRFEHDYLNAQIKRFDGNISRTADFVGMERSALHRKLRSLGVHYSDKPN